jgi:hypothetical protein
MTRKARKAVGPAVRSTRRKKAAPLYEMPIVNAARKIVGWTRVNPVIRNGEVFHDEAQRLVVPIITCYVDILDPVSAERAGTPRDWPMAWRCLAICSKGAIGRPEHGESAAVVTVGLRR